jgi:hypothetical protein
MIELKKEDVFQAFFAAGLEGDYNFLEDDLMKLAKAFCALRDEEVKEKTHRATMFERNRCIEFVRSLNPEVARALEEKKGPL